MYNYSMYDIIRIWVIDKNGMDRIITAYRMSENIDSVIQYRIDEVAEFVGITRNGFLKYKYMEQ